MGGSKQGTVAAQTPRAISTSTSIGSALDAVPDTFEQKDSEEIAANIEKKAKGTRGLRIPLATDKSPLTNSTVNGVQL